jgi:hypothetical protein
MLHMTSHNTPGRLNWDCGAVSHPDTNGTTVPLDYNHTTMQTVAVTYQNNPLLQTNNQGMPVGYSNLHTLLIQPLD